VFFFQAEDGIRDYKVTGVQTCALPISDRVERGALGGDVDRDGDGEQALVAEFEALRAAHGARRLRADDRRGGELAEGERGDLAQIGRASCRKEWRSWWGRDQYIEKRGE